MTRRTILGSLAALAVAPLAKREPKREPKPVTRRLVLDRVECKEIRGTTVYVDMSFALVTDATGAVTGALAIARDATARYEAERTLRERVAALERIGRASTAAEGD